ncbi:type II secretion system protein [Rhizobacter sp. P5_C2]
MVTHTTTRRGFTLIELLVVLAIVALLLTIVAPRTIDHLERARETTLKASLKEMRSALDQFEADLGRPPGSLDELVQRRYLRELPVDPVTQRRDSWISVGAAEARAADLAAPARDAVVANVATEGVVDVHSGAEGEGRDGTPYRSW